MVMTLRLLTAGESHGPAMTVILDGMPFGVHVEPSNINRDLARRQSGYGRGGRMRIESDTVEILSGIRHGRTLGTPIALLVKNRDHSAWAESMASTPVEGVSIERETKPRPGHADFAGMMKTGTDDARNILERASARETVSRTAAGALAKALLAELGVSVFSHVTSIGQAVSGVSFTGSTEIDDGVSPGHGLLLHVDNDPARSADPDASARMREAIDRASAEGDTLGGTFEVLVTGLPPGIGSYAQHDRRLDSRIASALISIPAIKAVGFGAGFGLAGLPGSAAHDELYPDDARRVTRGSNRAGGIEGGMTNGMPVVVGAAMKPIPTLSRALATVDLDSFLPAEAFRERSDCCAVPAASVVAEAAVALEVASAILEKFGMDTLEDIKGSFAAYLQRIAPFWKGEQA